MAKKIILILLIIVILASLCSCALLQKTIDKRTRFSDCLSQIENNVRSEEWEIAKDNLEEIKKIWGKIKPLMQIDIDHDYVYSIEEDFTKLGAFIDTKEKADSLATILLVEDTWKNIGSF